MKKIILSAAVAAMAFSTSAVAADKGIDIDVTGQAVLYYETHTDNGAADRGQFDQAESVAGAGVQLNLNSDLGNNFTFGSQVTYIGSLGLAKTTVAARKQIAGDESDNTNQLALTKIFIAKKIGNTTVKAGRQELPKSLSPLAFSEGWSMYKNTFDAIVAVNTDLPQTTLVGAYVSAGTTHANVRQVQDLGARTNVGTATITGAAYMATAQTKLIPMTTLTASFYSLQEVGAALVGAGNEQGVSAIWVDAQIAPKDAPLGLKVGLQGGQISPEDSTTFDDTNAFGAKVSGKAGAISFKAIYTSVDGNDQKAGVSVANVGTGTKSPLYSQMMYNQRAIDYDNDTVVLGVGYDAGSIGKFAANYGMTSVGKNNIQNLNANGTRDQDYNELDLVYKTKYAGVQYFAIAAIRDWDNDLAMNTTIGNANGTKDTILRFWARYNF